MSTVLTEVPQFASAHAAVKFAVNIVGRPMRPTMNRMSDKSGGGNGLTDIDAAGQAGIIMAKVRGLDDVVMQAAILARATTRVLKCECKRLCCSGAMTNPKWMEAINTITTAAQESPCNCKTNYEIRSTLIRKIYGEPHKLQDLAESVGIDRHTMSAHHGRIHRWLLGQKATGVYAATEGVENLAWQRLDTSLTTAGIVGNTD